MKNKQVFAACMAAMMIIHSFPSFAATETKIGDVVLTFNVENPEVDGTIPDNIDVVTTTEGVEITDAYFTNDDDEWERGDEPKIKVTLEALDGYYFSSYKLGRITGLKDVKSKSIKKDDDKYSALVTIKLDPIEGDLDTPEDPEWNDTTAEWDEVDDVDYYSVRLYRDDKKIVTISTNNEYFDFYPWMTKKGDYTFEVKAKADDSDDDSDWSEESDECEISSSEVYTGDVPTQTDYRNSTTTYSGSNSGGPASSYTQSPSYSNGWKKDTSGWQFYQNGNQVTYSWVRDGAYWYYIGIDGYMKTDWQQVNGVWYYMNPTAGYGPEGSMRIGWINLNGVWYYTNSSGAMVTGYQTIDGHPYYFTESGSLLMNETAPNGKTAGADGILK